MIGRMKKILEVLGFILVVQGAMAVLHEVTDWFGNWGVVRHIGFLDGYELYAGIVLAVLGIAICVASDRGKRRTGV
ncbi:hypothetical protein [Streptomyces syringium]|uniref:hypothetical protein n=1 Tax=Streptomyces syringium TaxID=76729 RepID=UPI0034570B66